MASFVFLTSKECPSPETPAVGIQQGLKDEDTRLRLPVWPHQTWEQAAEAQTAKQIKTQTFRLLSTHRLP